MEGGKKEKKRNKSKGGEARPFAIAEFDFEAENPMELSLSRGDQVVIKEGNPRRGWWLVEDRKGGSGYVPAGYLSQVSTAAGCILSPTKGTGHDAEWTTPESHTGRRGGGRRGDGAWASRLYDDEPGGGGDGGDVGAGPAVEEGEARCANGSTSSLEKTLADKLARGLISVEEHDHIVRISIEATEALESGMEKGESSSSGSGSGSSSIHISPDGKVGGTGDGCTSRAGPDHTAVARTAEGPPPPLSQSDQRAVDAAIKAMKKVGVPQDASESRIADLVGFGFNAVKAALCTPSLLFLSSVLIIVCIVRGRSAGSRRARVWTGPFFLLLFFFSL